MVLARYLVMRVLSPETITAVSLLDGVLRLDFETAEKVRRQQSPLFLPPPSVAF